MRYPPNVKYHESRTSSRQDTTTPFFRCPDNLAQYINETYVLTGLRESEDIAISEDGLTRIVSRVWKDHYSFRMCATDTILLEMWTYTQPEYNRINNIFSVWHDEYYTPSAEY